MKSILKFRKNVFINCPFDDDYKPLLKVILFTLIYCGFFPRIASESSDSGEVRVKKIIKLIKDSEYSIHDLSRIEPLYPEDLPRFNMPFELGIDIGLKEATDSQYSNKKCLIFEKEMYRYQKVLSDISGNDVKAHHSDPETLVRQLRNWLVVTAKKRLPSGTKIWEAYNEFYSKFEIETKKLGYNEKDINGMPISEFISFINLFYKPLIA